MGDIWVQCRHFWRKNEKRNARTTIKAKKERSVSQSQKYKKKKKKGAAAPLRRRKYKKEKKPPARTTSEVEKERKGRATLWNQKKKKKEKEAARRIAVSQGKKNLRNILLTLWGLTILSISQYMIGVL